MSSSSAGSAIANTFTQYWKACTYVTPRIPPRPTFSATMRLTMTTPTQYGASVIARSVTPAPFNCGTR